MKKCWHCKNQFEFWKKKTTSEYESQINFRKSHQISWNLDEILKSCKAKYTRGLFCLPVWFYYYYYYYYYKQFLYRISISIYSVPYPGLFWSWYTSLGLQTQTPKLSKVLISGLNFCHHSFWQSHESNVLSLFRMQNSQNFQGLCPWTPVGRAYSAP